MNTPKVYIDLKTDFGFKKLFGTEINKELLIDFLNLILPEKHQIEDLTYGNQEQLGHTRTDRKAVYDIYCMSTTGERFIVELQNIKQVFFKDRCLFYSTFPIQIQAPTGDWNFELTPIYTIAILNFELEEYKGKPEIIHHVQLKDDDGMVFYDKLNYIYIELPKFNKEIEECGTRFEKWLFVFRWLFKLQERPPLLQERVFKKLFQMAKIANLSEMERLEYNQSLKHRRDLVNSIESAKIEARKEGLEEARNLKNWNVIKHGLEMNLDLQQLSKLTDLPIKEIKKIIIEEGWKMPST